MEVVVGKLEPIDEDDRKSSTKNMRILNIMPMRAGMEEIITLTTNTDGNLEINSFEEEVIEEGEYIGEVEEHCEEIETTEDPNYDPDVPYIIGQVEGEEEVISADGSAQYVNHHETVILAEDSEEEEQDIKPDRKTIRLVTGDLDSEDGELLIMQQQHDDDEEQDDGDEDGMIEEHEIMEEEEQEDDPDYVYEIEDSGSGVLKGGESGTWTGEYAYLCVLCDRVFKNEASLKRHNTVCHTETSTSIDPLAFDTCLCCGEPLDTAHVTGTPDCPDCDTLFAPDSPSSVLDRHRVLNHPDENGVYQCFECKQDNRYKNKNAIAMHMRSLHPLAKSFTCRICCRDFTRKYHLDRHIAQTGCHGAPRMQYECQVCHRMFTRKDNLREHLRAHAEGQLRKKKTYTCKFCNKIFQSAAFQQVHERTHTGERPFPCDLCSKRFPSSGAMKKHRRMHTGERPYACVECKKRFAAKETLNRHVRTHTGEKPHICTFCSKAFIQAAQLRAHIFHHTGENAFTCQICGRAFNRRVRLTTHMRFVHEGEQPIECPEEGCSRTFYRKEDMARHLTLHSGERPFECTVCDKAFAVKSSLKLHMLTHRKEQPCSCEECGRAFIRQDCLMRHMRAKHRDVLEDILAGAEKQRLQKTLFSLAAEDQPLPETHTQVWNELTLTDSIRELLGLLVDEPTLVRFGWPEAPVDRILDAVIRRCGHTPASDVDFDYISRMRENAKLLFTVVIDDQAVKSLLHNQTVDEVIMHVLKLAKKE